MLIPKAIFLNKKIDEGDDFISSGRLLKILEPRKSIFLWFLPTVFANSV